MTCSPRLLWSFEWRWESEFWLLMKVSSCATDSCYPVTGQLFPFLTKYLLIHWVSSTLGTMDSVRNERIRQNPAVLLWAYLSVTNNKNICETTVRTVKTMMWRMRQRRTLGCAATLEVFSLTKPVHVLSSWGQVCTFIIQSTGSSTLGLHLYTVEVLAESIIYLWDNLDGVGEGT